MTRWTLAAALAVAGAPAAAQTLLEEMAETGRFERFLDGVEAAGLADRLTGPGPVTVLAPTDTAYDRFVGPELAAAFEDDPALARLVLLTHIAEGAAHTADDMPSTIDVANGETVSVEWTGSELLATVDAGTEVSEIVAIEGGDVRSGNGIAHPITGLLLPRNATLDAIFDPEGSGAPAVAKAPPVVEPAGAVAEAPLEEEAPIPSDGSYLDDLVEDADAETIRLAPTEGPEAAEEEEPEARVTVMTTDEDAAAEGDGVILLTPGDDATVATAQAPSADASPEASTSTAVAPTQTDAAIEAAEETAEAAADLVPRPDGDGTVIVEEMNVTVEAAPRVEPRTVAPSRMMGSPEAEGSSPPEAQPQASPGGEAEPAAASQAAAADGAQNEEAVLSATMVGWPVYGQDGEEVGEVENVIVLPGSGAVDGVLVEVGGFLGTGLGGHLVRLDLDEFRIDAADEALVAEIAGDDITQRSEYEGPELQP